MESVRRHIIYNELEYFKDGTNKSGAFVFNEDGSLIYKKFTGKWKLLSKYKLRIELNKKEFTYKFDADYTEAVLIKPERKPPSRISIVPADQQIR